MVQGNRTLLLVAEDELDYQRAVNVGEENSTLDIALLGNGYEYRRAAYLAQQKVPVVMPLNFPAAPEVERPESALEVTLETLQHWELAPSNGAFLAAAGVDFSLTSAGLEKPADFWPARPQGCAARPHSRCRPGRADYPSSGAVGLGRSTRHYRAGDASPTWQCSRRIPFTAKEAKLLATWVDGRRFPAEHAERAKPEGTWQIETPAMLAGELVIARG